MSGQITPQATPRLVIPYGDRPIIDVRSGNATLDMYQWMQRVNRGLGISITNIDTTITQVNDNTTSIGDIETDIGDINTELEQIEQLIGMLEGWVQVFLNSQPGPPPPPTPAAGALAKAFGNPFPPAPPKWPGAGNFIQLESHGVPEKISVMPAATTPLVRNELIPIVQGGSNVSCTPQDIIHIDLTAPTQPIIVPFGLTDSINVASYTINSASPSGSAFLFSGDNSGAGASGDAGVGTGITASATSGQAFLYTGDNAAGDTGAANITTGNATGGTSGVITIVSGPGDNTGNVFFQTGPASAGNSGNIALETGTATGTRGNIILEPASANTGGSIIVDAFAITSPAGSYLQFQTGDETVAATNSQDFFIFTGAPGVGGDSGAGNFGTGDNNVGGASGVANLYSGATSGAGQSGGVFVFSGDTSGTGQTGNTWVYTGNTAAGTANTGDVNILSGDSFGGASGNINLKTGAAATTRGEIILDALDLWLDAAGFWAANGAVATAVTGVGPTGAHTTVQEWMVVKNASGVTRYIPAF